MLEAIYLVVVGIVVYFFYRKMNNKPLFGKGKAEKLKTGINSKSVKKGFFGRGNSKTVEEVEAEEDAQAFAELVDDIEEIESHMIRHKDNTFVLYAEVDPVNYYLLDQSEQEKIDISYESWLASLHYHVRLYIQNRYIDLTDPLKEMQETMSKAKDLPALTVMYGQEVLSNLQAWQRSHPRYEQKRYILFTYQVDPNTIIADTEEELEEKIVEKAFNELFRNYTATKNALKRCKIGVEMLTKEGIIELLYVSFNRRKALKNRFYDLIGKENFSLYSTADQDDRRVSLVKEDIKDLLNELKKDGEQVS